MEPANDRSRLEWIAVAVVTAIGLVVRSWGLTTLGLTHFDEGIYALAGCWSLDPKGMAAIDPSLIPYAPPGFPILVGCSYAIFGRSDTAAILVSIVLGTATIPVVAWLGRRTFGPGAGYASAVFAALSGPHIAFSRMAMTDVSFTLAWLVAMGMGQRFLERPTAWRGIVMGLSVGLAQQFKYNGWLMGGFVALTAILASFGRTGLRARFPTLRTFGWGLLGALVAWLVVWPWFHFVDGHGGYSALLKHQRSYLGGFEDWGRHWSAQNQQAWRLGQWGYLMQAVMFLALPTLIISRPDLWAAAQTSRKVIALLQVAVVASVLSFMANQLGCGLIISLLLFCHDRRSPTLIVALAATTMTFLIPFYHPYPRLVLPLQAMNWLLGGWLLKGISLGQLGKPKDEPFQRAEDPRWLTIGAGLGGVIYLAVSLAPAAVGIQDQPVGLSESLRHASSRVAAVLPEGIHALRVLVRPPVLFYLDGRVLMLRQAGMDQMLRPGDPRDWALIDSAILRSESGDLKLKTAADLPSKILDLWEVVEEIPTTMSLPTALDLDPKTIDRSAPLWLLRPRRPGTAR